MVMNSFAFVGTFDLLNWQKSKSFASVEVGLIWDQKAEDVQMGMRQTTPSSLFDSKILILHHGFGKYLRDQKPVNPCLRSLQNSVSLAGVG